MGGFFGAVSRKNCKYDVFFGTDYHSHLGTRRAGMAVYSKEKGYDKAIHNIENPPFRTKFDKDVNEMSGEAANGFGRSADYAWLTVTDLRCDANDRENLLDTFPKLSEEAYRAILNANLRGVDVEIIYYNPKRNNLFMKLIELRNKLFTVSYTDQKLIDKLNKVLRKCGEKEIDLDELFKF